MSKPYRLRKAGPSDLDAVASILEERITWLRDRGSDQWNTGQSFRTRLANSIACGETWLLEDGGWPIATVTISHIGDSDFWTPEELAQPAVYVTKTATSVKRSGEGLGELILRWVQDYAAKAGDGVVRWDVWRTNKALQDYYRRLGARFIRSVDIADRWSGALFELPVRTQPDLETQLFTVDEELRR